MYVLRWSDAGLILKFLCQQEHGGDPNFEPSISRFDVGSKRKRKRRNLKNSTTVDCVQGKYLEEVVVKKEEQEDTKVSNEDMASTNA